MNPRPETVRPAPRRQWRLVLALLLAVSALSTIFGMRALVAFDQTPGKDHPGAGHWPAASRIERTGGRPELLVFVHQFCSCTVATLNELARIPAKRKQGTLPPAITFLFYRPEGGIGAQSSPIVTPELWKKAQSLPGSRVVWDAGGQEARRFGADTSGLVLLYNAEGLLLFRGGVTASRGHEGDNDGLDELVLSLDSGRPSRSPGFVFGCSLKRLAPRGEQR